MHQLVFAVRCYANAAYVVVRCLSVRQDIFKKFSPLGSHTILVFPYQMSWQYSNRNPPQRERRMQVG